MGESGTTSSGSRKIHEIPRIGTRYSGRIKKATKQTRTIDLDIIDADADKRRDGNLRGNETNTKHKRWTTYRKGKSTSKRTEIRTEQRSRSQSDTPGKTQSSAGKENIMKERRR